MPWIRKDAPYSANGRGEGGWPNPGPWSLSQKNVKT